MKKPPAYGKEVLLQCSHIPDRRKGKSGIYLNSTGLFVLLMQIKKADNHKAICLIIKFYRLHNAAPTGGGGTVFTF